jgi:hypothetical protein
MELRLSRRWSTEESTIGELSIDGDAAFRCFILEDVVRPAKVHGKTAIPAGRYQIVITKSPRFGRLLPLLLDVPNYSGIRIHPGNKAGDTEGCLLPGDTRGPNFVGSSRAAFNRLYPRIKAALAEGAAYITITNDFEEAADVAQAAA